MSPLPTPSTLRGIGAITDADLLRVIETVDKRRARGGDRKSEEAKSKAQPCAIEKSSESTGKVVGVSARKVEQVRTVLSDPEVAEEVRAGKVTINKGAKKARAKKAKPPKAAAPTPAPGKPKAKAVEQDQLQAVVLQALTELRAWRHKYGEYQELAAIFEVIDKNYPSELKPGQPLPRTEELPLLGDVGAEDQSMKVGL